MRLGSPPSRTFLSSTSIAGKSQYTMSKFLYVFSATISPQILERFLARSVVNSLTVSLLLSQLQQGLMSRQLRNSQTSEQVTPSGWMSAWRLSQSMPPSPMPKMTKWLPSGTFWSTVSSSRVMYFLKSSGLRSPSRLFLQTSLPMSSRNMMRGWSSWGLRLSAGMLLRLLSESAPLTAMFWKSLWLQRFQSRRYLQTECETQGVWVCPVQADSCGRSSSSASRGSKSSKVPFLIIVALKYFSGMEKWAPAESPMTATPYRLQGAQNLSSQSRPRLSRPKMPLQSWSRSLDPVLRPGQMLALSSLQSAPRQLQPRKVETSEQVSLSRSKTGKWPLPKRSTKMWMSHFQGEGMVGCAAGERSKSSCLPLMWQVLFWQRPTARQALSAGALSMSVCTMTGPAKWMKASQVALRLLSKSSQNPLLTKSATPSL